MRVLGVVGDMTQNVEGLGDVPFRTGFFCKNLTALRKISWPGHKAVPLLSTEVFIFEQQTFHLTRWRPSELQTLH